MKVNEDAKLEQALSLRVIRDLLWAILTVLVLIGAFGVDWVSHLQ